MKITDIVKDYSYGSASSNRGLETAILVEAAELGIEWADTEMMAIRSNRRDKSDKTAKKRLKNHIKSNLNIETPYGVLFTTVILPFIINTIVNYVVRKIIELMFKEINDPTR